LPHWAAAVIGVLVGLFGVGLLLAAIWFYRRRRRQRQTKEAKEAAAVKAEKDTENPESPQFMYGSGPTAPGPGPLSDSTGVTATTTEANNSTVQDSLSTSIYPHTVESGGDEVYEMHGISSPTQFQHNFCESLVADTTCKST
jgi:cytoskeletal protein RodZ